MTRSEHLFRLKNDIKHTLLRSADVQRVHIIGCARSGTSMLLSSFIAFENTIFYARECSVWAYPSLRESLAIFKKFKLQDGPFYCVTKRDALWWQTENVEQLAAFAIQYKVRLISLVRDPRDVLTSRHSQGSTDYYVAPSTWAQCMAATDTLAARLKDHQEIITVRYEDVVTNPQNTQQLIESKLGMKVRSDVKSWSELKDNLSSAELGNSLARVITAMHKLRNFDPSSIAQWKTDAVKASYVQDLLDRSLYRKELASFMSKYHYSL